MGMNYAKQVNFFNKWVQVIFKTFFHCATKSNDINHIVSFLSVEEYYFNANQYRKRVYRFLYCIGYIQT